MRARGWVHVRTWSAGKPNTSQKQPILGIVGFSPLPCKQNNWDEEAWIFLILDNSFW
jgi:hypothetical protein